MSAMKVMIPIILEPVSARDHYNNEIRAKKTASIPRVQPRTCLSQANFNVR